MTRLPSLIFLSVVLLLTKCDAGDDDDDGDECKESCVEDEKQGKLGNHCYHWPTARKKWEDAELFCQDMDGHLAAVTTLEIHEFLMERVNKDDYFTWFWIGGSDKETEEKWKWTDRSPWNFTHWASVPQKQPKRAAPNHDCLQIYNKHKATNGWKDQSCVQQRHFICSWKICPEEPGDKRDVKPGGKPAHEGNLTAAGNGTLADIFGVDNNLQAAGILSALILPAIVLIIIIIICCVCKRSNKKKETKKEENLEVDENPVYQQYQFVGEDYESLERQYSTHEAVDRNIYYEQVN